MKFNKKFLNNLKLFSVLLQLTLIILAKTCTVCCSETFAIIQKKPGQDTEEKLRKKREGTDISDSDENMETEETLENSDENSENEKSEEPESESLEESSKESAEEEKKPSELVLEFLSEEAKGVVGFIPKKDMDDFAQELDNFYSILTGLNISDESRTALADVKVISMANDAGAFTATNQPDAIFAIESAVKILSSAEKSKYDSDKYEKMKRLSEKFAESGKKTGFCLPENVIFLSDPDFSLQEYAICYNGDVLISIEDLFNDDSEVNHMENNSTIVVKTQEEKVIEIEAGSQEAYCNDAKQIMNSPIINVDGQTYVPCADMAKMLGKNTISSADIPAVIVF
ncbi:MAG: hypothetical protein LBK29_03260 [Oscillospiraceae bacterium]|nr:hypothetical protein [Oscillospiraceae bacterium]